jgi:GT2 family glycosyltransferase
MLPDAPAAAAAADRVAVVIPSWNGRSLLETCLPALMKSTMATNLVVVVDNGSTDGTADWLLQNYPEVRLIRNEHNMGFAAAVNQGIVATQTEWVALLNNDALAEPDWLGRLLETAVSDARIGAVASRMMFRDNTRFVSSAGIRMDASGGAWDLLLGESSWPTAPIEVFGASAGACLYRRRMLQDIGLFDEAFFAYLEDVDLAWRARLRGWKTVLNPHAVVYHAVSATGVEGSPFKRYYLARNKWRVIVKNFPLQLLLRNMFLIGIYDALSIAKSILGRDGSALRGRLDALRDVPRLVRQRHQNLARQSAAWTEVRAALSPIESPMALYRRGQLPARLARH